MLGFRFNLGDLGFGQHARDSHAGNESLESITCIEDLLNTAVDHESDTPLVVRGQAVHIREQKHCQTRHIGLV